MVNRRCAGVLSVLYACILKPYLRVRGKMPRRPNNNSSNIRCADVPTAFSSLQIQNALLPAKESKVQRVHKPCLVTHLSS